MDKYRIFPLAGGGIRDGTRIWPKMREQERDNNGEVVQIDTASTPIFNTSYSGLATQSPFIMSEADLIRLLDQLNRRVGGEPIPTRPTPTPPALAHIPSTPSSPTKPAFTSTADLASYYATRKQQKELEEELRKEVRMAEIREFVEREAKRIDREMREVSLKICGRYLEIILPSASNIHL